MDKNKNGLLSLAAETNSLAIYSPTYVKAYY